MPEVPTLSEAGFPDIVGDSWVGVLFPAGTPEKIITLLPAVQQAAQQCRFIASWATVDRNRADQKRPLLC
ncbi:hypothetical protein JQ597_13435 [Bradyrhizobium sp. AUGA SZCCT0177]|nr:hypothetical protein [Bradyrhizobium sp. AUGA SZCCT0177]